MKTNIRNNRGFTIVETLIVLAIAAIILVIVLLAVPALNRSSKNTTDREAAQDVASAIGDWESANSGTVPTSADLPASGASTGKYTITVGGNATNYSVPNGVTFENSGTVTGSFGITYSTHTGSAGVASGVAAPGYIDVFVGEACPAPSSEAETTATTAANGLQLTETASDIAVVYASQSGGNSGTVYCIQA